MTIWDIRHDTSRGYHGLAFWREDDSKNLPFLKGQHVSHLWHAPRLFVFYGIDDDDPAPNPGDFPNFTHTDGLVCSERALQVLQPLLADSVEVLPLACDNAQFYMLNVLNILDCVDHTRSIIEYYPSGRINRMQSLYFKPGCIGAAPIFKIPERILTIIFVSDAFKALVEDNHLEGLVFKPVLED